MSVLTSAMTQANRLLLLRGDGWLDNFVASLGLADSFCLMGILVDLASHVHDLGWQTSSATWRCWRTACMLLPQSDLDLG